MTNLEQLLFTILSHSLKVNKGIGVENLHYLNDGLWRLKSVK